MSKTIVVVSEHTETTEPQSGDDWNLTQQSVYQSCSCSANKSDVQSTTRDQTESLSAAAARSGYLEDKQCEPEAAPPVNISETTWNSAHAHKLFTCSVTSTSEWCDGKRLKSAVSCSVEGALTSRIRLWFVSGRIIKSDKKQCCVSQKCFYVSTHPWQRLLHHLEMRRCKLPAEVSKDQ